MKSATPSLSQDVFATARNWLTGRRVLTVAAVALAAAGLALGWDWLVALGLAPILVAVLPCAAMCALGLCMHKMMGKSGTSGQSPGQELAQKPDKES